MSCVLSLKAVDDREIQRITSVFIIMTVVNFWLISSVAWIIELRPDRSRSLLLSVLHCKRCLVSSRRLVNRSWLAISLVQTLKPVD